MKLPSNWTQSYLRAFGRKLRERLTKKKKKSGLVSITKCKRKEYYGFTNEIYQTYIELVFNNMATYYESKRIIEGKNSFDEDEEIEPMYINVGGKKHNITKEAKLYESNISPLLRYFHDKNII